MTATDFIKEHEDCRLLAYLDERPKTPRWTIGWGHTGPEVHAGLEWTQAQADAQLVIDMSRDKHVLEVMIEVPLTSNQWVALQSLVYNIGLPRFETSRLRARLNAKDYQGAADELISFDRQGNPHGWIHADGIVLAGLVRRRTEERDLFLTPDQPQGEPSC